MGYDMTWVNEPTEVTDAYATAFDALGTDGGSVEDHRADIVKFMEIQEQAGSYYRLNIWGMQTMRELLYSGDCLSTDEPPAIPIDDAIVHDTGGVLPIWKVGSNDGWLVSPRECVATSEQWVFKGGRRKAQPVALSISESGENGFESFEEVMTFADEFVAWIAEAANHGGFRVY